MKALITLDYIDLKIESKESYETIKRRVFDGRAFLELRSSKGNLYLLNKGNITIIEQVEVKKKSNEKKRQTEI